MANTSIMICGKKYDIGTRVVLWDEKNGLNGYDTSKYTVKTSDRKTGKETTKVIKGKRYSSRSKVRTVNRAWLNKYVTQFFLHHSGLYRSRDTYGVLHKQRGLSVHFIMDDDGTIYQCLDVKERGWHGGKCNPISVGIEIDSRASVRRFPKAYDVVHQKKYRVGPRSIKLDTLHGKKIRGFDYSDGQYSALIKLSKCLCEQLGIEKDFPRDVEGNLIKGVVSNFKKYNGIICHYNITKNKIDPVSLDHGRIIKGIGGNTNVGSVKPFEDTIDLRNWSGRQEALLELGHSPGVIDGLYGPATRGAIMDFQQELGIQVTGEWDEMTYTTIVTLLSGLGILVK